MGRIILQKRRISSTDIFVSPIGLGTVKFGRTQNLKYPNTFTLPTDHELQELLAVAKDHGVNLLDTAPAYGLSEERVGKLLKDARHEWVISTKAGEYFENDLSTFDFSKAAIHKSIDNSLNKLKTDYLDIVFIHSNGDDEKIINQDQVFLTLSELKKAGKIRAFGMSTKTVSGGLNTIQHADIAMVTYNTQETSDLEVIRSAQQLQKGIFIKKALVSGHLTMSPKEHIDFVLKEDGVTSVIVGTINPQHLQQLSKL